MDEGRRRGKWRCIALQGIEGALEGTSFAGEPFAKIPNSWPDILEDGVRKERPSRGDGNRGTEFSVGVRLPQLAKDGGDSAGVFIPIVKFADPFVSTDMGTSGQPGF